jgi:hypothetical protein
METNLHHSFWKRADYNSDRTARLIRNDHRTHFVLPVEVHNDLHANIEPVERPTLVVGRFILDKLKSQPGKWTNLHRLQDLSERLYDRDWALSDVLDRQIPLLELGIESLKRRHL